MFRARFLVVTIDAPAVTRSLRRLLPLLIALAFVATACTSSSGNAKSSTSTTPAAPLPPLGKPNPLGAKWDWSRLDEFLIAWRDMGRSVTTLTDNMNRVVTDNEADFPGGLGELRDLRRSHDRTNDDADRQTIQKCTGERGTLVGELHRDHRRRHERAEHCARDKTDEES